MANVRYPSMVINGAAVVATPAEIDVTTTDELRAALLHAFSDRHPVVVVDMTGTRFCDSAGFHTLMAAHKRARAEGGELRLVIPADGAVWRVTTLIGMDRCIPCFTTLQEASPLRCAGREGPPAPVRGAD